ncbi:WavE lipopolysaccharide synthesis family protein [Ensifer sp. SL37]|uniref:WavE lipopolysaccharide synthesis family protein n=1 Tax=Ensifer sp. SL37 TaxID=2995137 RepID=UPI002273384F|nr:WavE lipopolysaccharide synthesis family protein [Ensifer sp. SL37]MCY1740367.1 hypothetical protein [Ensifer sp. SL37]
MLEIPHSAISVVIQGPIDWSMDDVSLDGVTLTLTRKLRELLPEAEIVLSTWTDERTHGLLFDKLVLNTPPAAQGDWPGFTPTNVNRQIISTTAGLKAADREFALKIRTDMVLQGLRFLEVFNLHRTSSRLFEDERALFKLPIVANNFSSRCTRSILSRLPDHPLPFHPSDHLQFGLRTDLLRLWDVPLQSDDEAFYFIDRSHPNRWRLGELSRLAPEQYIFTECLRKQFDVQLAHYADNRDEIIELSDYYMSSHFVFIPDLHFPVKFPKYHTPHHFSFEWMRRSNILQDEATKETTASNAVQTPFGFLSSVCKKYIMAARRCLRR